jgi:O-antigen ligase
VVGDFIYIFFLVLTVAYFVLALFKRDTAIVMLPIFFPTYLFKLSFYGIPFTLIEAFIWVSALAVGGLSLYRVLNPLKWWNAMLTSFSKFVHPRKSFFVAYKSVLIPIFLLVVSAFLSLIVTNSYITLNDGTVFEGMKIALGILKGWIISPILMFILILLFIDSNKKVISLLDSYSISAFFLGLWGLMQLLFNIYITPDGRASGPFESANYLALYIAPAVFYLFIRLLDVVFPIAEVDKHTFWRMPFRREIFPVEKGDTFVLMFSLLILLPVLFATKSYGAILAVFVVSIFYLFIQYLEYRRQKKIKKWPWNFFITVIFFAILSTVIMYMADPQKFNSVAQFTERNSSSVRMEVYAVNFALLKDNWLTGIGMGQYPAYYNVNVTEILGHAPYEENMLHPHNLFVSFWLYLGMLGFVALVWLIVVAFKRTYPVMKSFAYNDLEDGSKLRVMGFCMLLVILIHGLFDTPFFKNDLALLFWLVMGVIFAADNERKIEA